MSFRVDKSKSLYTGECPSDTAEDLTPESYCFCKESQTCGEQLDRVVCPFETDGNI